jgi:hypothetical protein
MTKKSDPTKDLEFQRVLKNLLSAPPKLHSEMTLGKGKPSRAKSPKKAAHKSQQKAGRT